MDAQELRILLKTAAILYKSIPDNALHAKDMFIKQAIQDMIVAVHALNSEIKCTECHGRGYILRLTDKPSDIPNRTCETCKGSGLRYNLQQEG